MAGLRNSRWVVLDRFLALTVGSHRTAAWSLGKAREAAFSGLWDDLAASVLPGLALRSTTDSNVNTACVYDVGDADRSLYISCVLPVYTAWEAGRFLDEAPSWGAGLTDAGLTFLGSSATRTLTPYVDDEAERRITYFEMLFEWIEGSDGPDESVLIDPWKPGS